MAGLGDPRVGAEPQPTNSLRDRRWAGAHDHRQPRQPRTDPLEVFPAVGSEHGHVEHQRVQAHLNERVTGHRAGQGAVIPAERFEPIREDLHETGVAIDDREPEPVVRALRDCPRRRVAPLGRHAGHCNARERSLLAANSVITGCLHAKSGDSGRLAPPPAARLRRRTRPGVDTFGDATSSQRRCAAPPQRRMPALTAEVRGS